VARAQRLEATTDTLYSEVRAMRGRHERLAGPGDQFEDREHGDPSERGPSHRGEHSLLLWTALGALGRLVIATSGYVCGLMTMADIVRFQGQRFASSSTIDEVHAELLPRIRSRRPCDEVRNCGHGGRWHQDAPAIARELRYRHGG
jgi:hypothetical protein